jgi:hypothetical protein
VLFVDLAAASWNYVLFMKREKSAYLGMRFDYLYSIYVIFAWRASSSTRGSPGRASQQGAPRTNVARTEIASDAQHFTLCIIVLVALAILGLPIGCR